MRHGKQYRFDQTDAGKHSAPPSCELLYAYNACLGQWRFKVRQKRVALLRSYTKLRSMQLRIKSMEQQLERSTQALLHAEDDARLREASTIPADSKDIDRVLGNLCTRAKFPSNFVREDQLVKEHGFVICDTHNCVQKESYAKCTLVRAFRLLTTEIRICGRCKDAGASVVL